MPQQANLRLLVLILFLAVHSVLVGWVGYSASPTIDESGHLPAGIYIWKYHKFDLYRVNPPLVKMIAAFPVVLSGTKNDWRDYREGPFTRTEWSIGTAFIKVNGPQAFWYFTLARWACIPFSLLGGYVCYRWARELYGTSPGILALILWCFSPNVIAWGSTITPDTGATALGVTAFYVYWLWLKEPTWRRATFAGLLLGLALLTKMTWILLLGLWPLSWACWIWSQRLESNMERCKKPHLQLAVILLLGIYVLNFGYGFEGSFKPLENYTFVSRILAGNESVVDDNGGGNRFTGSWIGKIPVPFPENYLRGIDLQKVDFELKKWSYLNGEWKKGGWWYYYLYALMMKVPLGTWGLFLLAMGLTFFNCRYRSSWRNELVLLLPAAAIFLLVSSQTGFSRYLRYVLPSFPFLFIFISKVAQSIKFRQWIISILMTAALLWSVGSSFLVYPHSMSYFNEIAGGPKGGHRYLIDANIDWGQDMLYLKKWCDAHPEARPLYISCHGLVEPVHLGIKASQPPPGPGKKILASQDPIFDAQNCGPQPGWYAISIHMLHKRDGSNDYFLKYFKPVATVGYSIYLYHITLEDANRVRGDLGLPLLESEE